MSQRIIYETKVDENNIKYRIEYIRDENNKIIKKITSKIHVSKKTIQVPKRVVERQKWEPFGQAIHNNSNTTTFGDEYSLVLSLDNDKKKVMMLYESIGNKWNSKNNKRDKK